MNLCCDASLGDGYVSARQKTRVISEAWLAQDGYCLNCNSDQLRRMPNNSAALDFACSQCDQAYELKSSARPHGNIVHDGSYQAMMQRLTSDSIPALLLMRYSRSWQVDTLMAIHPAFVTPAAIRKRHKPHIRAKSGREYQMCDLDLSMVPSDGKVVLVSDGRAQDRIEARKNFQASGRFTQLAVAKRGWAALVLSAVRQIGLTHFALVDVYKFESTMLAAYPGNCHVREKMRQQMQVLRDLGYVEFLGGGQYRLLR